MIRREFNRTAAGFLGSLALGIAKLASQGAIESFSVFDLHSHPALFFLKGSERYPGDEAFADRLQDMKKHGVAAAFFSLVADWPLLQITETGIIPTGRFTEEEGWKVFTDQLTILKDLLELSKIPIAISPADLRGESGLTALIACEGGDFLGGNIDNVARSYDLGVRSIQLVHYAPNDLGDLQTWKAEHNGLSEFGREVVAEMNTVGMLIDVAHASAKTVKDTVELSSAPVLLSHSILKTESNRPISARAISEGHARLVADNGGLIGMWPSGFSKSLEEFAHHTIRMIDVAGVDHVGIGTDMDGNFQPVVSNYQDVLSWIELLEKTGLKENEIEKITAENAQRILDEVL